MCKRKLAWSPPVQFQFPRGFHQQTKTKILLHTTLLMHCTTILDCTAWHVSVTDIMVVIKRGKSPIFLFVFFFFLVSTIQFFPTPPRVLSQSAVSSTQCKASSLGLMLSLVPALSLHSIACWLHLLFSVLIQFEQPCSPIWEQRILFLPLYHPFTELDKL